MLTKFKPGEIGKCVECGAHHPLNDDEICEYCFEPEVVIEASSTMSTGMTPVFINPGLTARTKYPWEK